jgi:hypothetical protein
MKQMPHTLIEGVQSARVERDPVVPIVTLQFSVEFVDPSLHRLMPVGLHPLVQPLQGGLQLFLAGFALENAFAFAAFAHVVGKAQKVKRARRLDPIPAVHLNKFGFLRVKGQSVLLQTLGSTFITRSASCLLSNNNRKSSASESGRFCLLTVAG